MDFSLTHEQRMLVDTVREFIRNELAPLEDTIEETGVLPPETARKLLVRAFLGDAFVALEDEEESERLMDVALGKLDKHL